ncbi:MAG: Ppx/GppA phosphatase family protein [Campylobacterota bacterium]|nr:Ppx/GppA phosphatase family protein [Campylobacterota bacterium]
MAKITTVIDIGSNSTRMVVFKKTSRYGYHLINESKSKVKISEGCYENNGNLQEVPMQRAFDALESFVRIAKSLRSRKILCVATSALRDAPNKKVFLSKVSKELGLNIKIIDGQKEAYYGGVATRNLIACDDFTTVDIGGGSTEFAFIHESNIVDTISLNIGTVRIKELFLDKNDLEGAKNFIYENLSKINKKLPTVVGLGGTARALSRAIIKYDKYPLNILHGFTYDAKEKLKFMDNICEAETNTEIKQLGVRKDRYDTIRPGTFIFKTILEYFEVQKVITSGVGVREGVYLCDILRTSNDKFPSNFNVSIKSLIDRFVEDETQSSYLGNNAKKIFDTLKPIHKLDDKYRSILVIASKLQLVGFSLNYYKSQEHTFWYILNGLNYGFTHEEKTLIAIVSKFTKKSLPKEEDIEEFKTILPSLEVIQWINFMMTLNITLNIEYSKEKYTYLLDISNMALEIKNNKECYLVKNELDRIKKPVDIELRLK